MFDVDSTVIDIGDVNGWTLHSCTGEICSTDRTTQIFKTPRIYTRRMKYMLTWSFPHHLGHLDLLKANWTHTTLFS